MKKIGAITCSVLLIIGAFVWKNAKSPSSSNRDGRGLLEIYAPCHARFAAAAQKEPQIALQEMLALKEHLENAKDEPLLHAHTLMRIAFLYQLLGQKEAEKKAWEEIEVQRKEGPLSSSLALVEETFLREGSGLHEYMRYRRSL